MFNNLKVGVKIALGFATALLLTTVIGVVAIVNLDNLGALVRRIATQEIPETSAVVQTERNIRAAHILSAEFDTHLNKETRDNWLAAIDEAGRSAATIIPVATELGHSGTIKAAESMIENINEYRNLTKSYTEAAFDNLKVIDDLDEHGQIILDQWRKYLAGQQQELAQAVADGNADQLDRLIATNNDAHTAIAKIDTLRKNEYLYRLKQDRKYADNISNTLPELIRISQNIIKESDNDDEINMAQIAETNAEEYGRQIQKWTANWQTQETLMGKADTLAVRIIKSCTDTAIQADKDAYEVGEQAVTNATTARSLLMGILITALVLGTLFAFLITRGISLPLNKAITSLNQGADQVAAASTQVSASSQQLAEGANEQAAGLEETSSSLEEITSMTTRNFENASQASTLVSNADQVVQKANLSMDQLTASMEEVSKSSDAISKIIQTIDDIAFQTNLLALNAAVEAARAGQAGSGFAVVADEVRNLAQRAASAARDTAELIDGTVKSVADSKTIMTETNAAFSQVVENSSKVNQLIVEITSSSREQTEGIRQINVALGEMDKVVQQNSANAEESASAAEELNAQAETMKEVVNDLLVMIAGNSAGKNDTSQSLQGMASSLATNSRGHRSRKENERGSDAGREITESANKPSLQPELSFENF